MKIILLQDVKNLGRVGDIKDVSEGYAQNFLLPKKLAGVATAGTIKIVEEEKARIKKLAEAETKTMRELAEKLKDKKITLKSRQKGGKLFGSITRRQVSDELKKENLEVLEKCIIMKETIKRVGEYVIEIVLSDQIKTKIKLEVVGE